MSDELIRIKNASYARYEELLIQRDAVKKEAFQQEREFVRVFGELILDVFRLKMECICKKKSIEYCSSISSPDLSFFSLLTPYLQP